jgi:hypothetical protein
LPQRRGEHEELIQVGIAPDQRGAQLRLASVVGQPIHEEVQAGDDRQEPQALHLDHAPLPSTSAVAALASCLVRRTYRIVAQTSAAVRLTVATAATAWTAAASAWTVVGFSVSQGSMPRSSVSRS